MAIKTWPAEVNSVRKATVVPFDEVTLPEEIFIVPGRAPRLRLVRGHFRVPRLRR